MESVYRDVFVLMTTFSTLKGRRWEWTREREGGREGGVGDKGGEGGEREGEREERIDSQSKRRVVAELLKGEF